MQGQGDNEKGATSADGALVTCYLRNISSGEREAVLRPNQAVDLGRGSVYLNVTDKRCARKQALVCFSRDKQLVTVTALGDNALVLTKLAGNDKTKTVLRKGQQEELRHGDGLALLPKVEGLSYMIELEQLSKKKRKQEEEESEEASSSAEGLLKKPKVLDEEEDDEGTEELDSDIERELMEEINNAEKKENAKEEEEGEKAEATIATTKAAAPQSTSGGGGGGGGGGGKTQAKKKKCKYGSKCYRKNPDHLRKFSHSPSPPSSPKQDE
ncbi:Hsp90 co-chaperone Cdc37 [Balamuthia mandrillaris]